MGNIIKTLKRVKEDMRIPLIIIVVLALYLIISLISNLFKKPVDESGFKIGELTRNETIEVLQQENRDNPLAVVDYNVYGESLNLFKTEYYIGIKYSETFAGDNIILVNLASNQEIRFEVLSDKLDQQIMLSGLDEGFYAVYSSDAYGNTSRLYMENVLSQNNTFSTICRDEQVKKIELIANASYFDSDSATESLLDRNYLYIKVSNEQPVETEYDIAIVTAPAITGSKAVSLVGEEFGDDSSEAEQLNDIALMIKEQLEQAGYRVTLIKNNYGEDINYYGEAGVVGRVFNSKVKYMIYLDMTKEETKSVRTKLVYSQYTQNEFAYYVFNQLRQDTSIFPDTTRLTACKQVQSTYLNDGKNYDSDYEIREVSGSVLGTGIYSETSKENAFASTYNYGVNCIKLVLCNVADSSSVKTFTNSKEAIANAIAKGTIDYLK